MAASLSQELAELLGSDALVPADRLDAYAVDGMVPRAVVHPSSLDGISQAMAWAAARGVAVSPRGGGTQLSLGNLPARVELVLDLSRHRRLLDYQPADLTATVEAGITLQSLQRELAPGGKFLPLEAPLPERATIGGILAADASGPLRFAHGLARDWLIGIGVVSAAGVQTRAGGKVVKNVTGYDLNKLYTGSLGTLGVIVEATFKLAPLPPASGALLATFPTLQAAVAGARGLLGHPFAPQGLQLVNAPVAQRLPVLPGLGRTEQGDGLAIAFFAGRERALRRRLEESRRFLHGGGATQVTELEGGAGRELLSRLTDLGWTAEKPPCLSLRVHVPPAAVARLVAEGPGDAAREPPPALVADPGFGTVEFLWWPGPAGNGMDDPAALATIERLRGLASQLKGWAMVQRCSPAVKGQIDVWGEPPPGMEVMRRIKGQFDPLGILNPGRFVGRL